MAQRIIRSHILILLVLVLLTPLATVAQDAAGLKPYFPEALTGSTQTPETEACAPYNPELDLTNDPEYGLDNTKAFPSPNVPYYQLTDGFPLSSLLDLDLRVYHFNNASKEARGQGELMKICVCVNGTQQTCRPAVGIYDNACYWTLDNVPANISPTGRITIFGGQSGYEIGDGNYRLGGFQMYNYICPGGLEYFDRVRS